MPDVARTRQSRGATGPVKGHIPTGLRVVAQIHDVGIPVGRAEPHGHDQIQNAAGARLDRAHDKVHAERIGFARLKAVGDVLRVELEEGSLTPVVDHTACAVDAVRLDRDFKVLAIPQPRSLERVEVNEHDRIPRHPLEHGKDDTILPIRERQSIDLLFERREHLALYDDGSALIGEHGFRNGGAV